MRSNMTDLPVFFMGVTEVRKSAFLGLWKVRKRIGLEFYRCSDIRHVGEDTVEFDVVFELFVRPAISQERIGVMSVNVCDNDVRFTSTAPAGVLKLRGKLSSDMQRIDGTVDITELSLMDVADDFVDSPIVLFAASAEGG